VRIFVESSFNTTLRIRRPEQDVDASVVSALNDIFNPGVVFQMDTINAQRFFERHQTGSL